MLGGACSSSGGGSTAGAATSTPARSATSACLTIAKALTKATTATAAKIGDRAGLPRTYAGGAAAVRKAAGRQPAAFAAAADRVADALDGLASKVRAGGRLVPDVGPLTEAAANLWSACA